MECKNVGTVDQIFRLLLAIVLLVIGLFYLQAYSNVFAILAGIVVLTALFQFCPLYKLVGINTCEVKKAKTVEEAKKRTIQGQTTKSKKPATNYKKEEKPKAKKSAKKRTAKKQKAKPKTKAKRKKAKKAKGRKR